MTVKCIVKGCAGKLIYRHYFEEKKKLFYTCGVCDGHFTADVKQICVKMTFKEWLSSLEDPQ